MSRDSQQLFEAAKKLMPGGVNSPVRAFGSVGRTPPFIQKAQGAVITDVEGRTYLDYVGSWGPMLLGHNHPAIREAVLGAVSDGLSFGAPCPAEVEMAEALCAMVPGLEMVRMVNSGTEAVMSALRLARGYTGRDKLIKFAGCYHGHSDSMLVKAGSGALTVGQPDSAGVPAGLAADTLIARYNDLSGVQALFEANQGEVAALILEPVAANMGVVAPAPGFLEGLRRLCDQNGALLIFDEVITGFRLSPGGAQAYYGVSADLVTYGKIIGAGMPVGAYGGKREIMEQVAPKGPVYQAGTLSGNPVAMAAGLAQLKEIQKDRQLYSRLETLGRRLEEGFTSLCGEYGLTVNRVGSLCCIYFRPGPVTSYEQAKESDTARFSAYFNCMLDSGIYLAPSQYEAMFISAAHEAGDIDRTLEAARSALKRI